MTRIKTDAHTACVYRDIVQSLKEQAEAPLKPIPELETLSSEALCALSPRGTFLQGPYECLLAGGINVATVGDMLRMLPITEKELRDITEGYKERTIPAEEVARCFERLLTQPPSS